MKTVLPLLLSLLWLASCTSVPTTSNAPETEGVYSGMFAVKNLQQFSQVYLVSPEALQGYENVIFTPLMTDTLEIDTSRLRFRDTWTPKEEDFLWLQREFAKIVEKSYQPPRGLRLLSEPADKTLKVAMALTKYMPNNPRDSLADRDTGASYFSEGAGKLFMRTRVLDAQSGELLALVVDERELGSTWQRDNRVNNSRRFRMGLETWVTRLGSGLAMLAQQGPN